MNDWIEVTANDITATLMVVSGKSNTGGILHATLTVIDLEQKIMSQILTDNALSPFRIVHRFGLN